MSTCSTSSRQKRLKTLTFLHFWLRNVLRATTACTFSTLFRHLNLQKWPKHGVFCTFWLQNVLRATTACTFSTSQLPKLVRHWGVLYILTSKCASRHNGVHFFNISTSKTRPTLRCFVHFDFQRCFAPQRRALFQHRNVLKWSDPLVFCPFWLWNVLRATTACNFSSLISPAGSAPAALASLLFDPPEPQIIGKTQCFATFLPFRASASSFLWLFLFSDLLSSHLSLLSASALLCFSSVHIVGSLASKLPSTSIFQKFRATEFRLLNFLWRRQSCKNQQPCIRKQLWDILVQMSQVPTYLVEAAFTGIPKTETDRFGDSYYFPSQNISRTFVWFPFRVVHTSLHTYWILLMCVHGTNSTMQLRDIGKPVQRTPGDPIWWLP